MPEQWTSVAAAAAAMNVHPRTIERRLACGKIESRRGENGQVQVLVNLPDIAEPFNAGALVTVKELADRQVDIAAGSASALVRIAQEQASHAQSQLLLARQDAGRVPARSADGRFAGRRHVGLHHGRGRLVRSCHNFGSWQCSHGR